jgi:phosphatidylinositol alpha-1,6-mannosyltransferase
MNGGRRTAVAPCWWFVTRKYPPAVGGMERLLWELTTRLAKRRPVHVIANGSPSPRLAAFMAACACRLIRGCIGRRVSLLHVGDAVLAPLAIVARLFRVPTTITLHGLDIVHASWLYRAYRHCFLRGFDAYVCTTDTVRTAAIEAGIPEARIHVIGIGVDTGPVRDAERDQDRLLFVGRLIPRKGVAWFVREVLPRVCAARPRLLLVIVGDGPERASIAAAAAAAGLSERLVWLGIVNEQVKAEELARATICVMPNVAIEGDMEGFGIVALEAAAAGCPLIASRLEGLCDSIVDGESGRLVKAGDAEAWTDALEKWLSDPAARVVAGNRAREHVTRLRNWIPIIDAYERLLRSVAGDRARTS